MVTLTFVENIEGTISGLIGGIACVYVSQPMDTIKVKMQTFPDLHRNTLRCIKNTWNTGGIFRGFYAGTIPAICCSITENSVLFTVIPLCQRLVSVLSGTHSTKDLSCLQHACAGSCCGLFTSLVMCPTELLKCKSQSSAELLRSQGNKSMASNLNLLSIARIIYTNEGVLGFYRGYSSTLAREVFGLFFYIGGNETARYLLTPCGKSKDELSPAAVAAAGGFGGACLWTMIFPLDVIKSRVQVGRTCAVHFENTSTEVTMCTSSSLRLIPTLLKIMRTEGFRSLYRGLPPTLFRTIPATATLFVVVEEVKKYLSFPSSRLSAL